MVTILVASSSSITSSNTRSTGGAGSSVLKVGERAGATGSATFTRTPGDAIPNSVVGARTDLDAPNSRLSWLQLNAAP